MSALPYFRWYPADAIADEKYCSLNDAELGFYHRCLDHAWVNGGLPADLTELAELFHRTRTQLDKVWLKVSKCWYEQDGRLFNRRQEEERAHVIEKSEANRRPGNANAKKLNANAFSEKRERVSEKRVENANDPQRARARADSDSLLVVDSLKQENPIEEKPVVIRSRPEWETDPAFQAFVSDYRRTGAAVIDEDFQEAFQWAWKPLDFEQRMDRHKALIEKLVRGYFDNPKMVPRPKKFLLSEWKRPAVVSVPHKESRSEMLDRQAREALEECSGQ